MQAEPRELLNSYLSEFAEAPELAEVLDEVRSEIAAGKLVVIENVGTSKESRAPLAEVAFDERKRGRMIATEPLRAEESLEALSQVIRRIVVDPARMLQAFVAQSDEEEEEEVLAPLRQGIVFASPTSDAIGEDLPVPAAPTTAERVVLEPPGDAEVRRLQYLERLLADLDVAVSGDADG